MIDEVHAQYPVEMIPVMPVGHIRFGRFELRLPIRQLLRDGQRCPLGGRAFDVLVVLLHHHDQIVSYEELFDRVWYGLTVEPNNLHVQVWTLRRLLGACSIITVARRGYRYVGPKPVECDGSQRSTPHRSTSIDWSSSRQVVSEPVIPHHTGETTRRNLRWRAR